MIMLSRFYINLHRSSYPTSSDLPDQSTSDPHFVRVVGQLAIGESLTHYGPSSSVHCTVTTDEFVYVDGEGLGNGGNDTWLIVSPEQHVIAVS